jgi:hypothetical protein|tara:strand:- start:49 stop:495 length:447 start_codon:yes stop_codon:yes gene_type:complete
MSSFSEIFETVVDSGFGPSDPLTPGKYEATIVSANTGTTKAGDFKAGFLIKDNDAGGASWMNQNFIKSSENSTRFFKQAMTTLGITAAMLDSDADAAVQTAVGKQFKITVVEKGDWVNIYLDKAIDAAPAASKAPAAPGGGGDWNLDE